MAKVTAGKSQRWILVNVRMVAQQQGSVHTAQIDRAFEMDIDDFRRLSFAEILNDDLHQVVDSAPNWDVPTPEGY